MAPVEGTPPTAGLPAGLHPGSRAAVPRRSEGTRLSSPSDDEVGGFQSAIRRERSEQSNTVRWRTCPMTAGTGSCRSALRGPW
jgi:hypothetical protein